MAVHPLNIQRVAFDDARNTALMTCTGGVHPPRPASVPEGSWYPGGDPITVEFAVSVKPNPTTMFAVQVTWQDGNAVYHRWEWDGKAWVNRGLANSDGSLKA